MEFPLLGCISLTHSIAPSQKTERGNSIFIESGKNVGLIL